MSKILIKYPQIKSSRGSVVAYWTINPGIIRSILGFSSLSNETSKTEVQSSYDLFVGGTLNQNSLTPTPTDKEYFMHNCTDMNSM